MKSQDVRNLQTWRWFAAKADIQAQASFEDSLMQPPRTVHYRHNLPRGD